MKEDDIWTLLGANYNYWYDKADDGDWGPWFRWKHNTVRVWPRKSWQIAALDFVAKILWRYDGEIGELRAPWGNQASKIRYRCRKAIDSFDKMKYYYAE